MHTKTLFTTALISLAFLANTGCLSIWSLESSKAEIKRNRVYASGDQEAIGLLQSGASEDTAIRAVRLDNGDGRAFGIGIDVSNLQALKKNFYRHALAALADAAMIWGSSKAVESLEDDDDGGSQSTHTTSRDNNSITINGDRNSVSIGDRSEASE